MVKHKKNYTINTKRGAIASIIPIILSSVAFVALFISGLVFLRNPLSTPTGIIYIVGSIILFIILLMIILSEILFKNSNIIEIK